MRRQQVLTREPLSAHCDLRVPRLCLGTMNFGEPGRGHQSDWTLDRGQARPIFEAAIGHGINFFDCANNYGLGASERVVGSLLRELLPRDDYIITTKLGMGMGRGTNLHGLSRARIMANIDASLQRLGLDYVDQLIIHRHPHGIPGHEETPIEETLEALHDVVQSGKARYLGASSMFAWQFVELQLTARQNAWTPFVSMQNHYNLAYREEEREMNPFCVNAGIPLMPWSPLARGILAGSYRGAIDKGSTARSSGRDQSRTEGLYRGKATFSIAERVSEIANKYGKTPAQISIAWLLQKPGVRAPVVGVSKIEQLAQLVAATDMDLDESDIAYLEEPYQPLRNLLSMGYS